MLKYLTAIIFISAFTISAHAQQGKRYRDISFTNVDIKYNSSYAADTVTVKDSDDYKFDLYTPHGDVSHNRPLVIWMHGGGFALGSKSDDNIQLWSKTFARRGYVCAAINYRKGKKLYLLDFKKLVKSCYPAVLDARQAVKYFRAHSAELGVDPKRIILAGNSAGGIIALQAAFGTNRELADSLRIPNPEAFGDIDGGTTRVMAVINFWGGIFNLNWLKRDPAAVISVYGSTDKIVHPGYYKGNYGGQAISKALKVQHHAGANKVFIGYGHELYKHFNPLPLHFGRAGIRRRWLQAGQFVAGFISKEMK